MISIPAFGLILELLAAIANIESTTGTDIRTIESGPTTAIVNEVCGKRAMYENLNCALDVIEVLEDQSAAYSGINLAELT